MKQRFQRTRATEKKESNGSTPWDNPNTALSLETPRGKKLFESFKTKLRGTKLGRINAKGENKFLNNKNSQNTLENKEVYHK